MRVAVTPDGSTQRVVLNTGSEWYDLTLAHQRIFNEEPANALRDIQAFIDAGLMTSASLNKLFASLRDKGLLDAVRLDEAPQQFELPIHPGKIICIGRNYAAHASETGHAPPKEPIFFAKAPSACIADGKPIVIKDWYGQVDHEAELAVVMGRRASRIRAEDAQEYIAGYTLLNDVTARDMQKRDIDNGHPWFRSKSIDTFCPIGPVLALPDELTWPVEVDIALTVNGDIRQQSNTRMFLFDIPTVLAFVTQFITLEPGDIVATGTPDGIGPIRPGDTVEVRIPEIGTLRNPVIAE